MCSAVMNVLVKLRLNIETMTCPISLSCCFIAKDTVKVVSEKAKVKNSMGIL